MITVMNDLPAYVLGISAEGKVTGADYENVLIPAVEERVKKHRKVRLLYHLGSRFSAFDLQAMFDDAKLGMKHIAAWEKIAFVSDHPTLNVVAKFFGYLMPCEVKIFKDDDLPLAKHWIAEG